MRKLKNLWGMLIAVAAIAVLGVGTELGSVSSIFELFTEEVPQELNSLATQTNDYPETYDGEHQEIVLNNNVPMFDISDLDSTQGVWQDFSDLDEFNRVGSANALIGKESFPSEKRESLYVKPSGWNQKKLDDGQWLYNRCHLIGFQLTGENNNMKNLMTGTRSFNTPHMLNYENQVMDYIRTTGNHVRYRVTPHFVGEELVARGIQMEAKSVEDDSFEYNVYIFNVQEGYTIDYLTGKAVKN